MKKRRTEQPTVNPSRTTTPRLLEKEQLDQVTGGSHQIVSPRDAVVAPES